MQKSLFFLLIAIVFTTKLIGQKPNSEHALTYKFVVTDYLSLDPIYRASTDRFLHPDAANYAAEIGYWYQLSPSFTIGGPLRVGSIDAYHNLTDPTDSACINTTCNKRYYRNEFFASLDALGLFSFNNGYLLKEDFFLQPYLGLGVAAVYMEKRKGNFDLQMPVALGTNLKLNPQFYLQFQMEYRAAFITQKHNLALSLGFLWRLARKAEKE